MLKKLMKYELMATSRVFLPLYAALICIAGVSWILMRLGMQTPGYIGIAVSVILIVGIFVLVLVLMIQRFRQNLLSNEGHLMMTLPVETDSLILSKLFVSSIWVACSFIAVAFAIFLITGKDLNSYEIARFFSVFVESLSINAAQVIIYIIECFVLIIFSILLSALILYACMSLSMLVNRNRGLFTFAAFIAISTAIQSLSAILSLALRDYGIFNFNENIFSSSSSYQVSQVMITSSIVIEIIGCAVFYLITRYMLKNRLNLQ